jgi:4-carboxymuconolactone decarboxylase
MAITETARLNHDELFPDRASTLARTDPELIERFDNFAFDESSPTATWTSGPG